MKRQDRLGLQPLLLRGGEAAELCGCSRSLMFKWMAANVVPVVRVPGSRTIRVPREALLKWIEERTQQPRGGAAA